MRLLMQDSVCFQIRPRPSPLDSMIQSWVKHLQHVDIPFRPWEYTGYVNSRTLTELVDDAAALGKTCGVMIDKDLTISQTYLNNLHAIFEKNYNGDQCWTDYHEHIHMIEGKTNPTLIHLRLEMNYRQLGGVLKKPFEMSWFEFSQTNLEPGDVYLAWDELGKKAHRYWLDQEPDDITRLCELVKPWLEIRPKIHISLETAQLVQTQDRDFLEWWAQRGTEWKKYHARPDWCLDHWDSVIVIGKLHQWQELKEQLDQKNWPRRIIL